MRKAGFSWARVVRVWRYVRDPAVGWRPKLLVLAALLYLLDPLDLFPDVIPGLGWVDDAVVGLVVWHILERMMDHRR